MVGLHIAFFNGKGLQERMINLVVCHLNMYVTRERIHCHQGCHAGCHTQVVVATVAMDTNT